MNKSTRLITLTCLLLSGCGMSHFRSPEQRAEHMCTESGYGAGTLEHSVCAEGENLRMFVEYQQRIETTQAEMATYHQQQMASSVGQWEQSANAAEERVRSQEQFRRDEEARAVQERRYSCEQWSGDELRLKQDAVNRLQASQAKQTRELETMKLAAEERRVQLQGWVDELDAPQGEY